MKARALVEPEAVAERPVTPRVSRRALLACAAAASAASALSGASLLPACAEVRSSAIDRRQILVDLVSIVVVPTYEEAARGAGALAAAVTALTEEPGAASLEAARGAWREARRAWMISDGFLLGPANSLALTGGVLDAGPPDVAKLEARIAGTAAVDDAAVASLPANQRGFPGLEALLFDPERDVDAIARDFTAASSERRRVIAAGIARDLASKIGLVRDAWLPRGGDYAHALADAGRGSSVYATERQGVDEVVNAIAHAAEVLIALRLAKPLGLDVASQTPRPDLVESPRSDASLDDIVAVLDGIASVYLCERNGVSGAPLADAVREFRASGDELLRRQLVEARAAVLAVPAPLRLAIVSHRDAAIAAHAAVREVKRRLVTDVAGALGTTIGFSVTDGD